MFPLLKRLRGTDRTREIDTGRVRRVANIVLAHIISQLYRLVLHFAFVETKSRERAPVSLFSSISIAGHADDGHCHRHQATWSHWKLRSTATLASSSFGRYRPNPAEPSRQQGRLDILFKTPQEPWLKIKRMHRSITVFLNSDRRIPSPNSSTPGISRKGTNRRCLSEECRRPGVPPSPSPSGPCRTLHAIW